MEPRSILSGIKVLDFASYVAGPAAATLLGDFGADVIKVEPRQGDFYRQLYRSPGMPSCDDNFAWLFTSRNKRSLALDLKAPKGREVIEHLLRSADIVVVNYPAPVRERLRIRYEDLVDLNERLIYASVTGYGEKGEEASNPGFDLTAWWARTGMMDIMRPKGTPPSVSVPAIGDHPTALALFGGILLALINRGHTGKGTHVSTSLLANGMWVNGILAQAMLCGCGQVNVPGPLNPINALNNIYQCRDERWFVLGIQNEDKCWPILVSLLKRPDLEEDSRFRDTAGRRQNALALSAMFREIFLTQDMRHWISLFTGTGVLLSPVGLLEDILQDRQIRANGAVISYSMPDGRQIETIDSPIWLAAARKTPPGTAPEIGAHTDEILREAGYSDNDIKALREAGVTA
jgi:crotonobetainyl-CoA:carnitine CoA-transferase CaiB-like acyl-CoA transferase